MRDSSLEISKRGVCPDTMIGQMLAIKPRATPSAEKPDQMARNGMQPSAALQMTGDVRLQRYQYLESILVGSILPE